VFAEVVHGADGEAGAVRKAWTGALAAIEGVGTGWLGATSGRAADGTFVALLCFEAEEMSRITMDRLAEATAWDPLAGATGGLTFRECPHVRAFASGGGDEIEQVDAVELTHGMVNDVGRVVAAFRKTRGSDAAAGLLCWDDIGFACSMLYRRGAPAAGERSSLADPSPSVLRRDAASLFVDPQERDLSPPWSVLGLPRASTADRSSSDGDAGP
jgi:hypothetical protein